MGSEWPLVRLADFSLKIGSGATPKGGSGVYLDDGDTYLIRSQNIYNNGFSAGGLVFITEDAALKLKNVVVEENDILLNITGDSVARVCLARKEFLPARVNQHVLIIRVNPEELDSRFVRYYLSSPYQQQLLLNLASSGATRNALTKSMIENFEVPKPPLEIQRSIADQLEAPDNKIQLNRQTNQTLEQMAQALFKSWFMDFDPVIDNALAAGNPIPPELEQRAQQRAQQQTQAGASKAPKANAEAHSAALPQHLRDLFPSEFEHTEALGWVPKGWEIKSLKELSSKISKGTTPRKADVADATESPKVKFLKVRDITDDGYILKDKLDLIPESISAGALKRSILKTNDILVSIAGTIGRVTVIDEGLDGSNCNQAVAFVRLSDTEDIQPLAKLHLQNQRAQDEMSSKIVQAVQANFSLTDLSEINILIPDSEVLNRFNKSINSYFKKKELSTNQSMSLTKLRDTLLPKLISGELRLPEAEPDAQSLAHEASA